MKKKIAVALVALSVFACGKDGEQKAANHGDGDGMVKTTSAGDACTADQTSETMCDGTTLLTCKNRTWAGRDCAAEGQVCKEVPAVAGVFTCQRDTSAQACTLNGQEQEGAVVFGDTDLFKYVTVHSFAVEGNELVNQLTMFALGVSAGQVVDFATAKDFQSCGSSACLLGFDVAADKTYMANGGTATFNQMSNTPGASFSVSLTDITLREVSIDWETYAVTEVLAGGTWCVPTLGVTGVVDRYPCYYVESAPDVPLGFGQTACWDETQTVRCDPLGDGGAQDLGGLVPAATCATGQTCSQTDAGAVCG